MSPEKEKSEKITDQDISSIIETQVVKYSKQDFSKMVEDLAWTNNYTYIEALTKIVEDEQLEHSSVKKLLSENLIARLEQEAESLNLIKAEYKKNRIC